MSEHIKVLYFAGLAEALRCRQEELAVTPETTTVGRLARALEQRHPALLGRLDSVRFAVNETFVTLDAPIRPGDTVALIPPVSGG